MQRVMVVGGPGSGKSTLARDLGARTGLPVLHLDHIHWAAGWVERPRDLRAALIMAEQAKLRWIIEGNFRATQAHRIARADLVVWLDLPLSLRLWRVVRRQFTYLGQRRPDMAEGCVEQLANLPSFLWYILRTARANRAELARVLPQDAGAKLVRLRSARDVRRWLDRVAP